MFPSKYQRTQPNFRLFEQLDEGVSTPAASAVEHSDALEDISPQQASSEDPAAASVLDGGDLLSPALLAPLGAEEPLLRLDVRLHEVSGQQFPASYAGSKIYGYVLVSA